MALGIAGTYKNPNNRDTKNIISVEISEGCNLNCRDCNTSARRNDTVKKHDRLVELLIDYFPIDSIPVFIGLGEPLKAQTDIINFLSKRHDIKTAHIQTNGSYRLEKSIIDLMQDRKISIGLSYDEMHRRGGQRSFQELPLQKEYVSGIAIAIEGNEKPTKGLDRHFQNLDRLLVHPAIDSQNKFKIDWTRLKNAISEYKREYPSITVYSDLSDFFRTKNPQFFKEANSEVLDLPEKEWKLHKDGFYVYTPSNEGIRFLLDGTYSIKPQESAHIGWEEMRGNTYNIERLGK